MELRVRATVRLLPAAIALILAPGTSLLAAGAPTDATARTFLVDLYTQYTDDEAPVLDWNGEDAPRLFEPRLADAIVSDTREAGGRGEASEVLDFDPFIQGQD
jgi:hypothetical protein